MAWKQFFIARFLNDRSIGSVRRQQLRRATIHRVPEQPSILHSPRWQHVNLPGTYGHESSLLSLGAAVTPIRLSIPRPCTHVEELDALLSIDLALALTSLRWYRYR